MVHLQLKKHPYEQLMIRIKNKNNLGYSLPARETFSASDYVYVEALGDLLQIEKDICR